ncbi:MAG: hypothetical protein ACRCSN_14515 [Dermatophilaceae bacterium]
MSEPTVQLDAGADVRAYVAAVRGWLADLPREDVDDLTTGMEADLAERAAEIGARLGDLLGEPETYATELRAAAGLPPRIVVPDVGVAELPRESWAVRIRGAGDDVLHRWPWLRELRPTWWLIRGAVLGALVMAVLGASRPIGWLLPLAGAGLSFAWSRRHADSPSARWRHRALGTANALAVVLVIPVTVASLARPTEYVELSDGASSVPALGSASGAPVTNVYAYGPDGTRLTDVRLFDANGNAIALDPWSLSLPAAVDEDTPDPGRIDGARFPLRFGDGLDPWLPAPDSTWVPPVAIPPVDGAATSDPTPAPTATPSATPTATPSATPTATPSASPTVVPTPSPTASPSATSSGSP